MARPRGEVRQALAEAIRSLVAVRGPVSSREAAAAAQVGYDLARETIKDMVRSARPEVVIAGHHKPPGQRWHTLYEPAILEDDDTPQPWGGIEALTSVVKGWVPES